MKAEIEKLLYCQQYLDDMKYPGYPFATSIVIDLEDDKAWIEGNKNPFSIKEALEKISAAICYQALICSNTTKGGWLNNSHLEEPNYYLHKAKDEDFMIDNIDAVRFYFALNAAIVNKQDNKYIFASIDAECDYIGVSSFKTLNEIEKYKEDYFYD